MKALTAQQLADMQAVLLDIQAKLTEQLDSSKSASDVVSLDQTLVGRVSRMDAMQQQQMAVSTRQKTMQRLRRVNLALAAIDSGDYGYCRSCDEPIGIARLQAQPETPLCIDCQNRNDSQQ